MNERHRLVIVGGSDAGIAAGMRAHQLDTSIEPLVVVADAYPNFSICGLPFYISGETPAWQDLAHRSRSDLEAAGLHLRLDHVATEIDADRQTLTVRSPDGGQPVVGYEQLIIGTGAVPAEPPIDGLDLLGVHVLHTMGNAFEVHEHITRQMTRRAVIVGAGYIGLELADAFAHRGLDITIVEMLDQVLSTVDPELAEPIRVTLERHGITVATGVTVATIERDGARCASAAATVSTGRPTSWSLRRVSAPTRRWRGPQELNSAFAARSWSTARCAPVYTTSTPQRLCRNLARSARTPDLFAAGHHRTQTRPCGR